MGSINGNLVGWSEYNWPEHGDEWSKEWGSTEYMWWGTIYPRIQAFVPPDSTILEIAPGYGRCTQYLKQIAAELLIVDLTDRCIEACKERFKGDSNIKYFTNDGKSLDMIPDHSIDFVFSWDSLVHVEEDVMKSYILELKKKLTPNGVVFLHHSNMGTYVKKDTNELFVENRGWRGTTVTAEIIRKYCEEIDIQCISQEIINWWDEGILSDCISVITLNGSLFASEMRLLKNDNFMRESKQIAAFSEIYEPKFKRYSSVMSKTNYISKLKNLNKDRPIYIWGAGVTGRETLELLNENGIKAYGFVDNDSSIWGNEIDECKVHNPANLIKKDEKCPFIIIASIHFKEISRALNEKQFIKNEDMIMYYELNC